MLKLRFQRTDLGRGLGLDAQKQPKVASVWYRRVVLPTRSVCNRAQVHHQNPTVNTPQREGRGPPQQPNSLGLFTEGVALPPQGLRALKHRQIAPRWRQAEILAVMQIYTASAHGPSKQNTGAWLVWQWLLWALQCRHTRVGPGSGLIP